MKKKLTHQRLRAEKRVAVHHHSSSPEIEKAWSSEIKKAQARE